MGEGVVVDVQTDGLGFLGQHRDPIADIGLEKPHPHAAFFVREACLKASGIGGTPLVSIDEGVVGRFVRQFDEGVELFFGDFLVPAHDEEIGAAKQRGLVEIAFGLIEAVLIVVQQEGGLTRVELFFVMVQIVVDHVVVFAVEEDGLGEVFGDALIEFALVHLKNSFGSFEVNSFGNLF